ncbi:hypothetical protein [Streptomyces platensis]
MPVDVVGLCVGEDDEQQATSQFAGATAVYQQQATHTHAAFLGDNVTRGFDDPPWHQLESGVHLHWALPDGLTRGGGPGAELDFPAVPNRWLVTRIVIEGTAPVTRSWLIESDALAADPPPAGVSSVTLPVRPSPQLPQAFGYLGRSHDVSQGWSSLRATNGPAITEAAGTPLNAVCNGEVGFAAYYPSCRGVFGFRDALDDLTPPATQPAQLAYSIIGWYHDPDTDPVTPDATPEQLETARGWTFTPADQALSGSIYAGVLQGIGWSPHTAYIHGQQTRQPLQAQAAIGNTATEALAAYFTAQYQPGLSLFETLLEALQSGLIESFTQPTAGGLTRLLERLHDQRLARTAGGTVYSIVSADDSSSDPSELINVPAPLAADLDQLNVLRRHADQCAFHTDWYRWQLFADWYRIFMAAPDQQNDAYAIAQQRYGDWEALAGKRDELATAASTQYTKVSHQLGPNMRLRARPAEPFVQPTDPAVLITGDAVSFPARYGGDGRFATDGYLQCRTASQLLTALTVGKTTLTADSLTGIVAPTGLPTPGLLTALLREACLLSTTLLANLTGHSATTLQGALERNLENQEQNTCTPTGTPPSPVGVNWWTPDQWLPLFAYWSVDYLPLQPTKSGGTSVDYDTTVINANFRLDQDAGGTLNYAPSGDPGSITVDPASAEFPQQYTGSGNLTTTPAQHLTQALTDHLATHSDTTLSAILSELTSGAGFVVTSLNGLTDALTMRQRGVQLGVRVPNGSDYQDLTQTVAPIIGDAPQAGGPGFGSHFNPLRAGYLKLSLTLVDVFGRKRAVQIPQLTCAQSMTTVSNGKNVPSVACLPPRIAQPSRLAFHWLATDGTGTEEMTGNPAVSPVCGWLMPSHLDDSLALYDQQGRQLGTLFLTHGDNAPVGWQPAPGNASTLGQDLATTMAYQNPQLRQVATALGGPKATAANFTAMVQLIDTVGQTIEPGPLPTDSDLSLLVGRPVAIVAAALRLELQGAAHIDLGWDRVGNDSDAGLTQVGFPVILGDLAKLHDGLIGFYKQATLGGDYDLTTFYSQGADPAATSGIVRPAQDTLHLTPTPPLDPEGRQEPPDLTPYTQRVLMLMDPRAHVHATTGILPTAALSLPPDQSQAAVSALDLSLFAAPVLRGAGGLAIPTPAASGYTISYVETSQDDQGHPDWAVTADITTPSGEAVWAYTPQEVREGWLRLNPILMEFTLTDTTGRPTVKASRSNALTLTVTNHAQRSVTFQPGTPVSEGTAPAGSVFYLHFGTLVAQDAVPGITLSAPGWAFQSFSSVQYGAYWAAAPTVAVTLAPADRLEIAVSGLVPSSSISQAQVWADYYAIDGIDDGVFTHTLTVQQTPAPSPR